jgi:hypothetical protein
VSIRWVWVNNVPFEPDGRVSRDLAPEKEALDSTSHKERIQTTKYRQDCHKDDPARPKD